MNKEKMIALKNWVTAKSQEDGLTSIKTDVGTHIYATNFEAEPYRRPRAKQNTLAEFLDLLRGINRSD